VTKFKVVAGLENDRRENACSTALRVAPRIAPVPNDRIHPAVLELDPIRLSHSHSPPSEA
jgi:hypothetical protein